MLEPFFDLIVADTMEEDKDVKDYDFDAVAWEAQRFDAVERKFQEVCSHYRAPTRRQHRMLDVAEHKSTVGARACH